jgi:hypothetical protein
VKGTVYIRLFLLKPLETTTVLPGVFVVSVGHSSSVGGVKRQYV